jgi:hypothetical protein
VPDREAGLLAELSLWRNGIGCSRRRQRCGHGKHADHQSEGEAVGHLLGLDL